MSRSFYIIIKNRRKFFFFVGEYVPDDAAETVEEEAMLRARAQVEMAISPTVISISSLKRSMTELGRGMGVDFQCFESSRCYEMRQGPRAYRGAGSSARTGLQLMCCATGRLLSSNFRNGFGGPDDEFKGQSMSISDWRTYMKSGTYLCQDRAYQGNEDQACIRVRVWGSENRTRGTKMQSGTET